MIENTMQQAAGQGSPGASAPQNAMATCPMARTCERVMEKAHSGYVLMLPGALLMVFGLLIFLEPRVVVWLVGTIAILLGIMFFVMARLIRRLH